MKMCLEIIKIAPRSVLLLSLCSLFCISQVAAQDDRECISGEYVVTISSNHQLKQKTIEEISLSSKEPIFIQRESRHTMLVKQVEATAAFSTGKRAVSAESENRLCARVRSGKRLYKRQARVSGNPAIVRNISCSCNAVLKASLNPNDPYYSLQWGLNQSNNIDIDAPEAWNRSTGSRNAVVAIIDTGVEYTHPDLVDNMWRNPGEVAGNGIDDDSNGYVDDVHGINAITGSGNPLDDNGHGTHCAGIIGAAGNNGAGLTGAAWKVSMIGVKFLGSGGNGQLYDAIRAIDYVTMMKTQYGVNIVATNNSWGSQGETWGPLGDAITRHQNAGILFVAAAGNESLNIDVTASSPAGFGADSVVSVAAVDSNGALASFSNYGATKVDLGAPGVSIASTYTGASYVYLSGTSMAAPLVSGAIGLVAATYPGLTWQNYKQILMTTGKPLAALTGKTVTGKMINLDQLMSAASLIPVTTPTPSPTPTLTATPRPTNTPTPTPTPTAVPTLAPGYWSISGQVEGNNVLLANAVIRLTTEAGTLTRLTDGAGFYSFSNVYTSAAMTITVEAAGFSFQPFNGLLQASRVINFSANSQQFGLSGRVLDISGNPVAGLVVDGGALGSATTDVQGFARFTVAFGAPYRLRVSGNSNWLINDPERSGNVLGATDRLWIAETQ